MVSVGKLGVQSEHVIATEKHIEVSALSTTIPPAVPVLKQG